MQPWNPQTTREASLVITLKHALVKQCPPCLSLGRATLFGEGRPGGPWNSESVTEWELCCNVCVIEGRCRRRHLIGDCEKMKPEWGQTNSGCVAGDKNDVGWWLGGGR